MVIQETTPIPEGKRLAPALWSITLVWFLVALASGASGFTAAHQRWVGPLVPVPLIGFGVAFAMSAPLRAWALAVDRKALVSFQTLRIGGGAFLALYVEGRLSGVFAVWAGVLDVVVGLSAPIVAAYWVPARTELQRRLTAAWMALGIVDFLVAIPLARIARAHDPQSLLPLGRLPLCMITTYFVPLALIAYFVLGAQLWRDR